MLDGKGVDVDVDAMIMVSSMYALALALVSAVSWLLTPSLVRHPVLSI
jgi:hypothetical protein